MSRRVLITCLDHLNWLFSMQRSSDCTGNVSINHVYDFHCNQSQCLFLQVVDHSLATQCNIFRICPTGSKSSTLRAPLLDLFPNFRKETNWPASSRFSPRGITSKYLKQQLGDKTWGALEDQLKATKMNQYKDLFPQSVRFLDFDGQEGALCL